MKLQKIASSPYFVASTGAALIAAILAPQILPTRAALGQTPATDVPAATAPTTAAPVVSTPTPTPANPNPFGLAAPATSTPIPVGTTFGGQATTTALGATEAEQIATYRARIQELQASLRQVPRSEEESEAQRRVVSEISQLQLAIQRLEAEAGGYAAYRRAREAQERGQAGGAELGLGAGPVDRRAALETSGIATSLPGQSLSATEAAILRSQKESLMAQYRQLQQTLRALGPNDEILATQLRGEQTALAAQLKDVEERLAAYPEEPTIQTFQPSAPNLNATLPQGALLPNLAASGAPNVAQRMQKAMEAAELLRQAGMIGLANYVVAEVPRLAEENYQETPLVPGAWAEGSGLAEERLNPFQQISPKEVEAIRASIDGLQAKIDAMSESLRNVETQLKLLTRQAVAAPTAIAPAETPAAEIIENAEAPTESQVGGSL
ncbi:MAG: hypothetical protein HUK22_04165 [Thermoguttaceae bacterium]|nr:hypothetical protein [Thermoguttaceae bacterium]